MSKRPAFAIDMFFAMIAVLAAVIVVLVMVYAAEGANALPLQLLYGLAMLLAWPLIALFGGGYGAEDMLGGALMCAVMAVCAGLGVFVTYYKVFRHRLHRREREPELERRWVSITVCATIVAVMLTGSLMAMLESLPESVGNAIFAPFALLAHVLNELIGFDTMFGGLILAWSIIPAFIAVSLWWGMMAWQKRINTRRLAASTASEPTPE